MRTLKQKKQTKKNLPHLPASSRLLSRAKRASRRACTSASDSPALTCDSRRRCSTVSSSKSQKKRTRAQQRTSLRSSARLRRSTASVTMECHSCTVVSRTGARPSLSASQFFRRASNASRRVSLSATMRATEPSSPPCAGGEPCKTKVAGTHLAGLQLGERVAKIVVVQRLALLLGPLEVRVPGLLESGVRHVLGVRELSGRERGRDRERQRERDTGNAPNSSALSAPRIKISS